MTSDCININIEDFISEIENWSAIWDLKHDDYSNKNAKRNAWKAVISKFVPNFNDMSEAEKKVIGNSYQRKWKSLRDSYTRELAKQKNDMKSGSATKFRKKYIIFDQLRFLDTTTKPTDDSIELSDHEGNLEKIEAVVEENINKMPYKGKPKKRHSDEDLLEVLKKKYYQQETKKSLDYENEDRLFLLSLCKNLQSIPDHMKLNVKTQMMNLIASAKQTACATSSSQLNPLTTITQYSHPNPIRPQFNINSYSSQLVQPAIRTNVNRPLNTQSEFGIEIPVYQNQTRAQHQDQLWPTTYSPEDASSVQSDLSNDVFSN